MDRVQTFVSAIPLDTDVLLPQQYAMIAQGYALQAAYGLNTVIVGLACTPTAPASMQVSVGPGAIIDPDVIESVPFGSLPVDTTDQLVKMGINTSPTLFTLTAPSTAGQSQNYLIQVSFTESDDTPETLTYYNSLNPNQPFTGPNNSGTPQNTRRAQRATLQLKVGTPANTGSQITPPLDVGWTGAYVITVNNGQTSVTSGAISRYPSSPFLAQFLQSHHGGVPGQAPKIDLGSEVTGILSSANLPTQIAQNISYPGNPNGHAAGTASTGVAGSPAPTMCWDTVSLKWWTCITTGNTSTAVWAQAQNSKTISAIVNSSSFVIPAGVTQIRIRLVGGGGGASGNSSAQPSGAGGGGGGYSEGLFNVTPGSSFAITIGAGGTGGSASGSGGTGGTSSFGALCSATGGQPGQYATGAVSGGGGGSASGGQINLAGGSGGDGWFAPAGVLPGYGGSTILGNGGRAGTFTNPATGGAGVAYGCGGAASYFQSGGIAGGAGAAGVAIVEY